MFGKRVGFLKFKADIIDKETGSKVLYSLMMYEFLKNHMCAQTQFLYCWW